MKKNVMSIFMIAGLLSVLLSGCRTGGGGEGASQKGSVVGTEEESETETKELFSSLPYQFARMYGIIKSEYPVYELDTVIELKLPQKEKTIFLTSAIHQKQELIVSIVLEDNSEVRKIPAGGEPPEDGLYNTLSDGTMIPSERYRNELWKSGEGLFLTGTDIPEAGIKPQESVYAFDSDYFEAYGHRRYIIEARFELPAAPDHQENLSGYALKLLDFEEPLEFALKRVPEYGTLEELAAGEHGSMDSHDGIAIISMGEGVKEGILISWYVYSEEGKKSIVIAYKPPNMEMDFPTISGNNKQYSIRQLSANPYWDNWGHYRLSDVKQYGRRTRYLFDVPQKEQNASFQINIPGITFLNYEESPPVTLPVPENYEELNEDIALKEGSVRILDISRVKGKGTAERPEVYINVMAVHEDKELVIKGLICQRKSRKAGWERERFDFNEEGNLSGFRVSYDEGDTEITLKFHGAAFYWNQPYVMQLPLVD